MKDVCVNEYIYNVKKKILFITYKLLITIIQFHISLIRQMENMCVVIIVAIQYVNGQASMLNLHLYYNSIKVLIITVIITIRILHRCIIT